MGSTNGEQVIDSELRAWRSACPGTSTRIGRGEHVADPVDATKEGTCPAYTGSEMIRLQWALFVRATPPSRP